MNVYNLLALIALGVNAQLQNGQMTMWTSNHDVITGSMCGYAAPVIGGLNSPAITNSHYFQNNRFLCAANQSRHPNSCGKCFRVRYTSGGTEPGRSRPGEAIIQIVDAMVANRDFDCLLNPFQQITGTTTGVFPISYEEVPCTLTDNGRSKLTVMDINNSWNTKVIVSNAEYAVTSVRMDIAGRQLNLQRSLQSATWIDGPLLRGETGIASFVVGLSNGATLNFNNCFADWPVKPGHEISCLLPGAEGQSTAEPTVSPTSATAEPTTPSPTVSRLITQEPTTGSTQEPTAFPTPAPTVTNNQPQEAPRCFINQCGCPGSFKEAWCNEDINEIKGDWCPASQSQCEQCSGTWCT